MPVRAFSTRDGDSNPAYTTALNKQTNGFTHNSSESFLGLISENWKKKSSFPHGGQRHTWRYKIEDEERKERKGQILVDEV